MSFLFFDTETTGLPLWREPSEHPGQPHIIQLAALLHDDDGHERAAMNVLIQPDGWTITDEITNLTGISQADAEAFGIPIGTALSMFMRLSQAGQGAQLVAHNKDFDIRMLRIELKRSQATAAEQFAEWLKGTAVSHCTADMATPIVNLPATARMIAAGFGHKPKRCKLSEAYEHFFREALTTPWSTSAPVRGCSGTCAPWRRRRADPWQSSR